jgi:GNAT superfamily N-acetyltransferase
MKIIRTNSNNTDFIHLVKQLDDGLVIINGGLHDFYHQFNTLSDIKQVVVVYDENPIACGAFKQYDQITCEIKRMFTHPDQRGKGYAGLVLDELEKWAKEQGYQSAILETSINLTSAIQLYKRKGYAEISKYGQYKDAADSVCFQKYL